MEHLNEKKVIVKRRYTEAYPAKNISTNARVRSVILDAISDGHITEEEMSRILNALEANKRWLSRNKTLFNISEDQAGIKTYSLSPYGRRVKDRTTPKVLNEALNVPHKEKGRKPVNMFVGRFQPFTLGHVKVFEKMYKENGLPVVVFLVRGKNNDPEKRPFDEAMQQAMFTKMAKQYPFLETAIVVPNGAIDTMFAAARPAYEPMMWGYGTDRKKSYGAMITKDRYREELGVDPEFKGFEIFRTDDNISASKVRNALKIDDEKTFKKMTPKSIHKFYKPLQDIIKPIKENHTMKNLKSLKDFSINESTKINEGGTFDRTTVTQVSYSGDMFKMQAQDNGTNELDVAEQMADDLGLVSGHMEWTGKKLSIMGRNAQGQIIKVLQTGEFDMYGGPYTPKMGSYKVTVDGRNMDKQIAASFKRYGWDGSPDLGRTDIWAGMATNQMKR